MTSELGGVAEQAAVIMIFPGLDNDTGKSSAVSDLFSNRSSSNTTMINPYDVPKGLIVLLAFLYGSISLLAVIGNGLVILVIVKNRRMHTVTNIFIANLAVSDVIIGLFSIPFQ
ncbi:neuropeptide Y receptor type 2, partial [Biomphalaria glabrata]